MNGLTLGERSRFQVERVRAVDGRVNRSEAPAEEGRGAGVVVVTCWSRPARRRLEPYASALGAVLGLAACPRRMLGLEVIWTPADPTTR